MKKISRFLLLSLLISAGIATAFAVSKDEIQTQIQATKKQLSDTKRRENSVLGTLIKTQKDLEKASSNLEDLNRKMGATEGQIAVISAQLNSAQAELEKIKTLVGGKQKFLDQRLVALYKHGYQSSLEVLFNAKDFAEFIFRFEMISDYIQGDLQVIRALQAQQDTIAKKKEEIASKQQELAYKKNLYLSMQSQTRAEQDRMLQLNKIKQKELEMLQNNKKALEESLDELEETSKQVEAQIKEYQSQNHVALGTGKYIWPVNGRITQMFGWRRHPILRKREFHTGLDISVPLGTEIAAADSGVVIFSGFNGGYGKMITIDHGSSFSTLYAHTSLILVDKGQTVTKGQIIAKAGSTGLSTGPHLHFEIRENGAPVNPLNYL